MRNDPDKGVLSYKGSPASASVIVVLSFFAQWLNWALFEKAGYSWKITLLTPLMLCLMYHFVQLDAGEYRNFSRRFFFVFSALVPLVLSILISAAVYFSYPHISNFDPEADFKGTIPEMIATYTGRFIITSLYLTVFAVIDIPVLKYMDRKKK